MDILKFKIFLSLFISCSICFSLSLTHSLTHSLAINLFKVDKIDNTYILYILVLFPLIMQLIVNYTKNQYIFLGSFSLFFHSSSLCLVRSFVRSFSREGKRERERERERASERTDGCNYRANKWRRGSSKLGNETREWTMPQTWLQLACFYTICTLFAPSRISLLVL